MNNIEIIKNSIDTKKFNTYLLCECDSHILNMYLLNQDTLILSCYGSKYDHKEFIIDDLNKLNELHFNIGRLINNSDDLKYISVEYKNYSLILEDIDANYLYSIQLKEKNKNYWDIILTEGAMFALKEKIELIINYLKDKLCPLQIGSKVLIKDKADMQPTFIDEIGRYHFNLHDGSDIVFNSEMEKLCGEQCIISYINKYIGTDSKVYCTFEVTNKDTYELYPYTFSIDMIDIL